MKNKRLLKTIFAVSLSFTLFGCGTDAKEVPNNGGYNYEAQADVDNGNNVIVKDTTRKIIYSASYSIQGKKTNEAKAQINAKNYKLEGYISYSDESETYAVVIYQVPTAKFTDFLNYIDSFEGIGSKKISTEDVTDNYNSTEAYIEELQVERAFYMDLLEHASSTSEIIQIKNKLSEIDRDLAQYNKIKSSLDGKINYSQVTVRYYIEGKAPKEPGFFAEYFEYLGKFFTGFAKVVLYLLPVAVIGGGIFSVIFFPIRGKKKRLAKKKALEEKKEVE